MRLIFAIVSGVKIVPSSTVSAMNTAELPPKIPENLSCAWMYGWSGHCARASVSMRICGPGSGEPIAARIAFAIGYAKKPVESSSSVATIPRWRTITRAIRSVQESRACVRGASAIASSFGVAPGDGATRRPDRPGRERADIARVALGRSGSESRSCGPDNGRRPRAAP